MVIDHKNRNPLDCRRENLRFCTPQQNTWNSSPHRNRKYSRYKGVYLSWYYKGGKKWTKLKPWYVQVMANGKTHCRGNFADEKEAYEASVDLMKELHGEYAGIEPWRGYSDTPALRETLGRKNDPADDKTRYLDESGLFAWHRGDMKSQKAISK